MSEPTILVVDDEPNVVRLCRRLLERANFTVLAATGPSQALAILARQPVDLLLADIRMPGLDGFELLSLAHRHQPDMAAVIMTGYGTLDTAIEALHRGADGLILKPFSGNDLVDNVRRALDESQQKRDAVRLHALRPLFDVTAALFAETGSARLKTLILETVAARLDCPIVGLQVQAPDEADGQPAIIWHGAPAEDGFWRLGWMEEPWPEKGLLWVSDDPPIGSPPARRLLAEQGLNSLIAVTIWRERRRVRLLAARPVGMAQFREVEVEMFQILAHQSAAALENARLYEDLRETIRKVEESQQAMVQTEKMAAAGRLTASIAHEINNPLQSLHNCLHLADRQELSVEDRAKYMGMAKTELDRLMTTVQRMLDFYRPGVRDRNLTDINELLRRVLLLLEAQLAKSRIVVHTYLAQELPRVMVVPGQIQQVLINLILNAMEAMPNGGEITITTEAVENGAGGRPGVSLLLEDSGPGIPEESRTKVFEPFVSTKENGTGLGLSVSYGIISAHGGSLTLEQGKQRGACFRIRLPEGENG